MKKKTEPGKSGSKPADKAKKKPLVISRIDRNMGIPAVSTRGIEWHDPTEPPFRFSGLNWFSRNGLFRRLPVMDGIPEGVETLSVCTTAVTAAFKTDAKRIILKVRHSDPKAASWNLSWIGTSGFDLYTGGPGNWSTIGVSRIRDGKSELFQTEGERKMREFLLNFPLYNGITEIRIGVDRGAKILPPTPFASDKRIVTYGGSVMQGASASRPGRAFMNIIGRHFNMEVINLGFSGSSRLEPIMAKLTAEVDDPAVMIIEGDRNAGWERVRDLEPGFIRTIRKKHPGVPIVVMQGNPWWEPDPNRPKIMAEQQSFMKKMQPHDPDLYWWDCTGFIGPDHSECLVDGRHPSDLGFQRMADHMIEKLSVLFRKYGVAGFERR